MTYRGNSNNLEGNRRGDDPNRWYYVKIGWSGWQCSPDEDCEVLDGEVNDEAWDKNGNKNVADSDDTHNLIK